MVHLKPLWTKNSVAYSDIQKIHKNYLAPIGMALSAGEDGHTTIQENGEQNKMKRSLFLMIALVAFIGWAGRHYTAAAHTESHEAHEKNAFTPDTIPWGPAPPFLAPGAQFAVLEGDPTAASGDYTVRLKMPDGYRIAPHFHQHRDDIVMGQIGNLELVPIGLRVGIFLPLHSQNLRPFSHTIS